MTGFWLPVVTLLAVAVPVLVLGMVRPPKHRHDRKRP